MLKYHAHFEQKHSVVVLPTFNGLVIGVFLWSATPVMAKRLKRYWRLALLLFLFLRALLDDKREVPFPGSEEHAWSLRYHFRRADYALRYICVLKGWQYTFPDKPNERDAQIEELKQKLEESENIKYN